MKIKRMKLPIVIISIGLIVAIVSCLLASVRKKPTVTEYDFAYSVTYKLNGEVKTLEGVYKCRFEGFSEGVDPLERYYTGEYTDYDFDAHAYSYTIAKKDGLDLCITTSFNNSYLMGDTGNEYYESSLEEPYLSVYDEEGVNYDDEETLGAFDAEIISWDYPEPIENTFVFDGLAELYYNTMLLMLLVGILTVIACMIFVKKDAGVVYGMIDTFGILLNFAIALAAIPFLTLIAWIIQAFQTGPNWIYQVDLCIPAITAFTLAASVSLRRKGFAKTGFFIQLVGPALFVVLAVLEMIL